ncbi:MAG: hypothetical protein AB7I08_13285 [Thermoleophilia bacterium]
MRLALLTALVALAAILPASAVAASSAPAPRAGTEATLALAGSLQKQWGLCPTARPAHKVITQARRTTAATPRAKRAKAALRSWTEVARVCATPVPQPIVIP